MEAAFFEEIMARCPQKKVASLCKKLAKQGGLQSGARCEALCHLAYWLYIYGQGALAMRCAALTHGLTFNGNFNQWTFIHNLWGLEMRLLRQGGQEAAAARIARAINKNLLAPTKHVTAEARAQIEQNRRGRATLADAACAEKVAAALRAGDEKGADDWRFIGLVKLASWAETGLYPQLNAGGREVEAKIDEYRRALARRG